MTFMSVILGLLNGALGLFNRLVDYFKELRLISWGEEKAKAELAKEEIEINRRQTEILSQDRTKEDVIKKMEDGSF